MTDAEIFDMAERSRLLRRLDEQDERRRRRLPPRADACATPAPRPPTPTGPAGCGDSADV